MIRSSIGPVAVSFLRKIILKLNSNILSCIFIVHAECNLSPCDVLEIFSTGQRPGQPINTECTSDLHWRKLDRRLQAIEQPGE